MKITNISDGFSNWNRSFSKYQVGNYCYRFEIMKLYKVGSGFTTFDSTRLLFGLLRFICSDISDFNNFIIPILKSKNKVDKYIFSKFPIFSLANEIKVLKNLRMLCFNTLQDCIGSINIIIEQRGLLLHYIDLCNFILGCCKSENNSKNIESVTKVLVDNNRFYGYYNEYWKYFM